MPSGLSAIRYERGSLCLRCSDLIEQRYATKFCVKLGKSGNETFQMLQEAYKDEHFICKSHNAFRNGRKYVEGKPREGRPSTTKTAGNIKEGSIF